MINKENKAIYENLIKLKKSNYRKGIVVFIMMVGITVFGLNAIKQENKKEEIKRIENVLDNQSVSNINTEKNSKSRDTYLEILGAINIPLFILMIYFIIRGVKYSKEANRYCPYCYTKDYVKTTLYTKKIRTYVKKEKYRDSQGKDRYKNVLYEDWEGQYRNECCGNIYNKTWQEKIDLED